MLHNYIISKKDANFYYPMTSATVSNVLAFDRCRSQGVFVGVFKGGFIQIFFTFRRNDFKFQTLKLKRGAL